MKRLNILFILPDGFGWRDLQCYGSTLLWQPGRHAGCSVRIGDYKLIEFFGGRLGRTL